MPNINSRFAGRTLVSAIPTLLNLLAFKNQYTPTVIYPKYVTTYIFIRNDWNKNIIQPTLAGIQKDVLDYKGFIYFGIMMDDKGAKLLEYNARLGDPETEVLMPALDANLVAAVEAALAGNLSEVAWNWHSGFFVDVVLTSGGYPKNFPKGFVIHGLTAVDKETLLFYAGVKRVGDDLVTDGGRVINVVCHGESLDAAIENAYRNCNKICFEGMHYRKDIGRRKLKNTYV
jgi:phosphoribosylamine--glycine ligase